MPFPYTLSATISGLPEATAETYARQLKQLLPRGLLWFVEEGGQISNLMLAIGDELARISSRGADLIEESDPRTALETLDDWERVLGLPDDAVLAIPATDEARRLAITQKLVGLGGQTPAYFVQLAAACGYSVTIDESHRNDVLRAGFRAGDRTGHLDLVHTWTVVVDAPTGPVLTHAELEAIITRAAPAHTVVLFQYS